MDKTQEKCVNYTANEECDSDGRQKFSMTSIKQPLSYIVIIIFATIVFITCIQLLSTFIFYIWFQILMINNFVIESDEFNSQKMKMHEMYYYKLLNYIHCFEDPLNDDVNTKTLKPYSFFDFNTSNSCYNKEPYAKITLKM